MSTNISSNNTRIAKNTLALFVRMLFMMLIALYTSRVVLQSLGEENYGVYNVVGGFVAMFSILSGPLSNAIQRFLTFELGRGDTIKLKAIFSTSINIQIVISIIAVILCETIGIWFLNNKMVISAERLDSANFVLQCSIATFVVNLISVPYNATIISHEKMNFFAFISVCEALLKLGIAYLILISPFDLLNFYAVSLLIISLIIRYLYAIYCKRHFEETNYKFAINKPIFKEMASFAGWNFFGNTAYVINTQGVNMLMNVFFGIKANAARAIAVQVEIAVGQFANSFTTAINPQITKSYAARDDNQVFSLIMRGSKFSFLIMFLLIVPIVLEADTILKIWLKQVPQYTVIFTRLVVFCSLATVMGNSMYTGIMATGNIRRYQIIATLVGCLVFPVSWIAYSLGASADTTYIIYFVIYFSLNLIRLLSLKHLINFPIKKYIIQVLLRLVIFSFISFTIPIIIVYVMEPSIWRLFIVICVSTLWGGLCSFYIGFDSHERQFFMTKIKNIIKRNL